LRARVPAHRLGVALGTSTASIAETEAAYLALDGRGLVPAQAHERKVHDPQALAAVGPAATGRYWPGPTVAKACSSGAKAWAAAVVQEATGWYGPVLTVSTACSSGAKAWAAAARWLQQGLCDAVLVGGCDTLCGSTLHGFASLELTSAQPCRPFDRGRDGISIGEAAAFAILVRDDLDGAGGSGTPLYLAGYGESSDAHHMSAPHPHGKGARLAITAALRRAGLAPADIDYINLHGTATRLNDQVEAALVA